ncbi:MAG: MFS transporter [Armatimonadota bacterium]
MHKTPSKWLITAIGFFVNIATTLMMYGQPYYAEQHRWTIWQMSVWQMAFGVGIAISAVYGGKFVEKYGADRSLNLGLAGTLLAALVGIFAPAGWNLNLALLLTGIFPNFIWPATESTLMRGENNAGVQRNVLKYNLGWAGGSATAFFFTSKLASYGGPNFAARGLFGVPALMCILALVLSVAFMKKFLQIPDTQHPVETNDGYRLTAKDRKIFRRLGWIFNPMGYVILTICALLTPQFANKMHLNLETSSMFLSVFFLVRLSCFVLFGRWKGWCYHVPMLLSSYFGLAVALLIMMLAPNIYIHMIGQVILGFCLAMGYQASLFYSMAGSETKGEHGGGHEAVIGLGIGIGAFCVGCGSLFAQHELLWKVMAPGIMGITVIICGGLAMYSLTTNLSFWKKRG